MAGPAQHQFFFVAKQYYPGSQEDSDGVRVFVGKLHPFKVWRKKDTNAISNNFLYAIFLWITANYFCNREVRKGVIMFDSC